MRNTLLMLSTLVAVTFIASAASEASPLAGPSALAGAIDQLTVVDKVHCRPGSAHHTPTRWRHANGCQRAAAAPVVVPGHAWHAYPDNGAYDRYYNKMDYQTRGIFYGD